MNQIDELINEGKIKILSIDELVTFLKGLGPVQIVTPEFHRTNGIMPVHPEGGREWFDALKKLPHETLVQIGMGVWEEGHYLYPGEWYSFIPEGYLIIDINGEEREFRKGITDGDIRYDCLAFGFIKE